MPDDTDVNCAQTAEPIEMPLGLWTWVDQRKHVLDCAQIPHAKGQLLGGKDMPGHARRHWAVSCARMAELIDLPVGLWTRVGRRKHKFNRIRQVASMCPHWRNLANTIESPACGGDASLCQIALTTYYILRES